MRADAQNAATRGSSSGVASAHASALVIDSHADTPQRMLDEGYDLDSPLGTGQWSLPTAREGGLGAEFFPSGWTRTNIAVVLWSALWN